MKNQIRMVVLLVWVVALPALTWADPILTVFTDRSVWETAVGGLFSEENFNSFGGVSYEFAPVDVGDFSISVSGTTFGSIWHNVGPVSNGNDVNGTGQINAATGEEGGTTLSFEFPIVAFGGDWDGISDDRTTSINVDGTIVAIPHIEGGGFWGFVSDTPFSDELLFLSAGAADGFGIDNVVYSHSRAAAVPEPATLILLMSGLGTMSLARWIRRRK